MKESCLLARFALRGNEGCVPVAAIFDDAALGGIINVNKTETFAVALGPLKVVEKGPDNVAFDRYTLSYDLGNGLDVPPQVVYALLIVDIVGAIPLIVEGGTTFGDNQRFWGILSVNTCQDVGETIGEYLPAHFCVGRAGNAFNCYVTISSHLVFP